MALLIACSQKNSKPTDKTVDAQSKAFSFDFDGNYLPTDSIISKGHLLNSIEILTRDSAGSRVIELIYLRFTNMENNEYHIVKPLFTGTRSEFLINANDSILGEVIIRGEFFGEKGPRKDNIDPKTIVFSGELLADGRKSKLECTYFEGD